VGTIATPVISPAYGIFRGSVNVTLRCDTPNVEIYYTYSDAREPDDPTDSDDLYVNGTPIVVIVSTWIKAIGILSGWSNSGIASSIFIVAGLTHQYNKELLETGTEKSSNLTHQYNFGLKLS